MYIEAKRIWNEGVKNAKTNSYNEKIESLNQQPNSKAAWRFVSNLKRSEPGFSRWNSDND